MSKSKSKSQTAPIDQLIGSKLRTARFENDMSQEKLAAAIGLTFQQIQKYESGFNRIPASRLKSFAEILDKPVNYFYGDDENERTKPADRSEGVLLSAYRDVKSSKIRASIVMITQAVSEKA